MALYFETPIEWLRLGDPARGNVGDPCAAASPEAVSDTGSGELLAGLNRVSTHQDTQTEAVWGQKLSHCLEGEREGKQ